MASVFYSEDLSCCICLTIFTDPVMLHCGHSFCRTCIAEVLKSQDQCPQCRTRTSVLAKSLQTSHVLKSLAEKAKEAEKIKKEHGSERAEVAELLCYEHDEKLKLFCVTDQQLTCIICRDGEKHEGHKFKPVKEAAASLWQEMKNGKEEFFADIHAIESQANSQREGITKTKKKSHQLMTQICSQFEEMHQFLRKREDEIKKELKHKEDNAVEKMSKNLNAIETALSESRELERNVTTVLNITDPQMFLKSWTEGYSMTQDLFRPRADDLQVVNMSLSMGHYESHLQFLMWKEMLQVIQPQEEMLSLKSNIANITVSDDGSLLYTTNQQTNQAQSDHLYPVSKTSSLSFVSVSSQPAVSTPDDCGLLPSPAKPQPTPLHRFPTFGRTPVSIPGHCALQPPRAKSEPPTPPHLFPLFDPPPFSIPDHCGLPPPPAMPMPPSPPHLFPALDPPPFSIPDHCGLPPPPDKPQPPTPLPHLPTFGPTPISIPGHCALQPPRAKPKRPTRSHLFRALDSPPVSIPDDCALPLPRAKPKPPTPLIGLPPFSLNY